MGILKAIEKLIIDLIISFINIYQKTLSFDHGTLRKLRPYGQCRFYPTCSAYSVQSLRKYGLIKGGVKSIIRVFRCHPWSDGGIDYP